MAAAAFSLGAAPARADDGYRVIHTFSSAPGFTGGVNPNRVVAHQAGNNPAAWALYGSTVNGVVCKLTPPAPGSAHWIETRLYVYKPPSGVGYLKGLLAFDGSGAIYTIAETRSRGHAISLVLRLTPPSAGQYFWSKTVLATFQDNGNEEDLVVDPSGHVFGRTGDTVYELSPPVASQQTWTKKVLYKFSTDFEIIYPSGRLLLGPAGELYGATVFGGESNRGTIYRLSPPTTSGGTWVHTVLFSFNGVSGPNQGLLSTALVRDAAGNLYGSRSDAEDPRFLGDVFKLSPPAAGPDEWTFTRLHAFSLQDGCTYPGQVAFLDGSVALYGGTAYSFPPGAFTSELGGCIYKLTQPVAGQTAWSFTTIHRYANPNGERPEAGLTHDAAGVIYGSTRIGGATASGTIFKLSQ